MLRQPDRRARISGDVAGAEGRAARRSTASRTSSARIDYVALGAGAGRRHPGADAGGSSRSISTSARSLFRAPEYRKVAMLALTPDELAKPDRGLRRGRARTPMTTAQARYGTPETRDICSRSCSRTRRRPRPPRDKIAKGTTFDGARRRARPEGQRHRSRHRGQSRDRRSARSPTPPSRSRRARSARRSQGRFGTAHRARSTRSSPARSEPFEEVAAEIKQRHRRPSAPRTRSPTLQRQDRGRARRRRDAGRDRQEARPDSRAPSTRSTAPAATPDGKPVADLPKRRRRAHRRVRGRRRRRERAAAAAERRLRLVRRRPASRRRASARSTRSRTRSRRAGATTRSPTRLQDQGRRELLDKLKAGTPLADVAAADRLNGRDGDRTSSAAAPPPDLPADASSPRCSGPPKDGAGSADGATPTERDRVPRHRASRCRRSTRTPPDAKRIDDALQSAHRRRPGRAISSPRLQSELGVTHQPERAEPGRSAARTELS